MGVLGKASQARYRLHVRCADLKTLGDLLGIVTAQKSATLNSIEWGYPHGDAQRDEWLVAVVTRANAKAALTAGALGVRVLGVHSFSERNDDEGCPHRTAVAEGPMVMERRTRTMTGEDLGLEISHTKTVQVSVEVEYLISARVDVFVVQHVHELEDGEEDVKMIGVYSTREAAELAVGRIQQQPGFCDLPDGFCISRCQIDKDHWSEGYVTLPPAADHRQA